MGWLISLLACTLPPIFCGPNTGFGLGGVLAAVVLGGLGVPDEVIVDDYALSAIGTSRLMQALREESSDAVEEVEKYADNPSVIGYSVTSTRFRAVNHDSYMPLYSAIQATGKPLSFHSGFHWGDQSMQQCNKFISMHAISFAEVDESLSSLRTAPWQAFHQSCGSCSAQPLRGVAKG